MSLHNDLDLNCESQSANAWRCCVTTEFSKW